MVGLTKTVTWSPYCFLPLAFVLVVLGVVRLTYRWLAMR